MSTNREYIQVELSVLRYGLLEYLHTHYTGGNESFAAAIQREDVKKELEAMRTKHIFWHGIDNRAKVIADAYKGNTMSTKVSFMFGDISSAEQLPLPDDYIKCRTLEDIQKVDAENGAGYYWRQESIHDVMNLLKWPIKSFGAIISIGNLMQDYLQEVRTTEQGKKDANFRVGVDVLLQYSNNKLSYREFAIICAINAILGTKNYSRITAERIHAAAHGYRSDKLFEASGTSEQWSIHATKREVAKLIQLKFFRKITVKKRISYYSYHIKTDKEFHKVITEHEVKKIEKKYNPKIESNDIDQILATKEASYRAKSNIQEQLTLELHTGDRLYSIDYLTTKTPPDELNMLIQTATEVTIQGAKFYSFSRLSPQQLTELFEETLQKKLYGATDANNARIKTIMNTTDRR